MKTISQQLPDYFEYFEDGERYLVMSWQDVCFVEEQDV
mgnify:CR=1 FL=1